MTEERIQVEYEFCPKCGSPVLYCNEIMEDVFVFSDQGHHQQYPEGVEHEC